MLTKVRELSKDLAVYGIGDVAVSVVNFLLLPIYVLYLTETDYGVLAQLGAVEVIAKILFRFGLDGAFMRLYYDYPDERDRRRLASTIFSFLLVVNAALLAIALVAAPHVAPRLFAWGNGVPPGEREIHVLALRLVLANTFVMGFTFFPFHLLRMEKRSGTFSALAFARTASTLLVRILFVMVLGFGVLGLVIADILVTAGVLVLLSRSFARLIRPVFSPAILRESLSFGLPRVPHAFAQQVMAVGDRIILPAYRGLGEIGIYSMGASFALTQKLFLSAFESAWAPFYYATARETDGARVFSVVATYAFAVLAMMTAGLSAIAPDLLQVMVGDVYAPAAAVVPWIAIGVLLQGIYLLTSIGLNITKHTQYYPVATAAAAGTSVVLNLLLIPRYGIFGAAWANAAAYGVQAVLAFRFSQRFYRIEYEWGRLAKVAASGLLGYVAATQLPGIPPGPGLIVRGATVVAVMVGLLAVTGFFKPAEVRVLKRMRRRFTPEPARGPTETTEFGGEIIATTMPENGTAKREEVTGGPKSAW